jgi:hypothetical protein
MSPGRIRYNKIKIISLSLRIAYTRRLGSVAYALVVFIFFNLRQIGIQLSEPFGYEPRHLQIQEYLMRGLIDHRQLLSDAPLLARDTISKDGVAPDLCAPLTATYDMAFFAAFRNAEVSKQMALTQGRFGFPGITAEDRDKGVHPLVALQVDDLAPLSDEKAMKRGDLIRAESKRSD